MPTTRPNTRKPTKSELELVRLAKELSMESQELRIQKTVFDLDSKDDVKLVKVVQFTPVTTTHEALARINNDATKFLEIINAGLKDWTRETAATDTAIAWSTEDEEGNLAPFSGTTLSEEKSKQLQVNALNMAKLLFGYAKDMVGGKIAKSAAKQKAFDMLLSNPQVVEALKS